MLIGLGTAVNIVAIAAGTTAGVFAGSRFAVKSRELITDVLGFIVVLAAADAVKAMWDTAFVSSLPRGWPLLSTLFTLLVGGLIGSWFRLEDRLNSFGIFLRAKFGQSSHPHFVEGFVASSLLFAIGSLEILRSIQDGMGLGQEQLFLKSTLDFFAAMAFAASLGWGVIASIIPVALYQWSWTGIGYGLGNILAGYQIQSMTVVGGVLLMGISLRLLKVKEVAVGNLLPALFLAPAVVLLAHNFV